MSKYSDEDLIIAVNESTSCRQVLIRLGLAPQGGNYATVKKAVVRLSLDTSHWTGQSSNKGKKFGTKRPTEDYLNNRYTITSHSLRLRLLKEGIFPHKCNQCGLSEWMGGKIPLELEHINGNHLDNSLNNLELLCPNCHALTPTYRGKNIKAA